MKSFLTLSLFFFSLLLFGCETTETRIDKNPDLWANLPVEEQIAVENNTLEIGQSQNAVFFIMGNPDERKVNVSDGIEREVWVYTRVNRNYEGEVFAGYRSYRVYDKKAKVYRVYRRPVYESIYSQEIEVVSEIEFEYGRITAITELKT